MRKKGCQLDQSPFDIDHWARLTGRCWTLSEFDRPWILRLHSFNILPTDQQAGLSIIPTKEQFHCTLAYCFENVQTMFTVWKTEFKCSFQLLSPKYAENF
ncbi:hypothetical protein T06_570 [Trichinella sp. T6]|nr:hypothetical protein T06_570 [Trichinella sp. T6]